MSTRNDQSGFSIIETLLVVVIIGIVGFTGWFVWHSKQATDKTLAETGNSQNSAIKKSATATNANVVKIPELGIELTNVPTTLKDLTYAKSASATSVDANNATKTPVHFVDATFSTQSLTKDDAACSATGGGIGILARTDGTYVNNGPQDNTAFVKQFNGFYITYSHPESTCSNSPTTEALHGTQTAAFEKLATTASNLSATN